MTFIIADGSNVAVVLFYFVFSSQDYIVQLSCLHRCDQTLSFCKGVVTGEGLGCLSKTDLKTTFGVSTWFSLIYNPGNKCASSLRMFWILQR